jgi:ADP-ribosylglycohydrolase
MNDEQLRGMLWGSFVADSLALGAHWIYDQKKIVHKFTRVDSLLAPLSKSQHAGKLAGDFTHYGDQALVLLRSLAARKGFDLHDFASRWREFWTHASSYKDQATRKTLANLQEGKEVEDAGSGSNDLAGAARIAPLTYLLGSNLQALIRAARDQTRMTHQDAVVVDSAEFFARVTNDVLFGKKPVQAMQDAVGHFYADLPAQAWVESGLEAAQQESAAAIQDLGKTCHAPHAFPGTVQLIARHEADLPEALIQCVMAGGDSAARGMLVGMVLGAYHGLDSLPVPWTQALRAGPEIGQLLAELDTIR